MDEADHYFFLHEVPREDGVNTASFYLESKARKWWRWLKARYENKGRWLGMMAFEQEFIEQWSPSPTANGHKKLDGKLAKAKQQDKTLQGGLLKKMSYILVLQSRRMNLEPGTLTITSQAQLARL